MSELVIGIDLGTTNSCVSIYSKGKTKILENSDGGRITPSFVYFVTLEDHVVGKHGTTMASKTPDRGIYEVKRLVGRKFKDLYIQENLKYLPFIVKSDSNGDAVVAIKEGTVTFEKTPQELCTIILKKLKDDAEGKLGEIIDKVVITVPAYFNVTQRKVTFEAAKEAGFTVLKLLNEPTAAALAYYIESDCEKTNYSLVYDLGGGTFDVAILKKHAKNIEILGVNGDTQLGGHDFDNLIVDYVLQELIKKYDCDLRNNKNSLRRLHNKCKDAKEALSTVQKTSITLYGFIKTHPCVQVELTREKFEKLADDFFKRSIAIVDTCLRNCGISKNSIDDIILCGGSTRIPKVQQMISDYFNKKKLNKIVNPDESVAEGAALQAALLSKHPKQRIHDMRLTDVIPLSLGVSMLSGEMSFLIKKNTPIPASALSSYVTVYNQQSGISFTIYEGERPNVKNNRLIGNFVISGLTSAPPGECKVKLSMHVDKNGILTARAKETYKKNVKEVTVNYTRGIQNESEIKNTLWDAENNKEEDERFVEFVKYKNYLLKYCIAVRYNMDKRNVADKHRYVYELCQETEKSAENMDVDQENQISALIDEIKLQCEPHVKYYNFERMPTLSS